MTTMIISEVPYVPDTLREAKEKNLLIPFIGAGLSCAVVRDGEAPPPTFVEFIAGLIERADSKYINLETKVKLRQTLAGGETKSVSKILREQIPEGAFSQLVRAFFKDVAPKPSQHHTILNLLGFKLLLTTNYDRILDQVISPRPEILTYRDHTTVRGMIDQGISQVDESAAPVIVKLNGDVSVPSTIALGQSDQLGMWDTDHELGQGLRSIFERLMSEHHLLFLGYGFTDSDYRKFLIDVGKNLDSSKRRTHYAALLESEWYALPDRDQLVKYAGIKPLLYQTSSDKNKNPHRGLWQFLSQISRSRHVPIEANRRAGSFFLPAERADYLAIQDEFESDADGFRYLTPTLTNAITTQDYLDQVCRNQLSKYRTIIGEAYWADWIDEVLDNMQSRMITLEQKLTSGAELRILCDYDLTLEEIKNADEVVLARYTKLLRLLEDPNLDIEIRLTKAVAEPRSVASFASLIRAHDIGSDIAVAYATQATTTDFETHIIEINTSFAKEMLVTFEKEWVRAVNENESEHQLNRAIARC